MEGDGGLSPSAKGKWCDISSVLDINIRHAEDLPTTLPVARYLKEVLLGLQGRGGDLQGRGTRVEKLAKLLTGGAHVAVPVCQALFWMGIGIVFGRMHEEALSEFRNQLAQSWYLLTLEALKDMPKDRESRDWCLESLPFVFAQAIFRLLCDAFEEDRKHFVGQAEKLLDKLSLVMHFEVTGFQVTADTVRKARKKLFLSRVLMNPHVDLYESEAAKKRMEMLDAMGSGLDCPLSFGNKDARPLEDMQMEHVMQGRSDAKFKDKAAARRSSAQPAKADSASPTQRPSKISSSDNSNSMDNQDAFHRNWSPQEDLSIERYEALSGNGEAMWGRHLAELSQILGDQADAAESVAESEPGSPTNLQSAEDQSEENFDVQSGSPTLASMQSGSSTPPTSKAGDKTSMKSSPPSSPKSTRGRPTPINTTLNTTPMNRSLTAPLSPSRFSLSDSFRQTTTMPAREPLVREPPRLITIAGNQVTWPAKSPPKKKPPEAGPWNTESIEDTSLEQGTTSQEDAVEDPGGSTKKKRKFPKKKVQTMGRMSSMWNQVQKDRKAKDVKEKRVRQEALQHKITVDPLPEDVCAHELLTTWVSPVMRRVATEPDRLSVLRKTQAERRQCKMEVPPFPSMSLLRPSSKEEGSARLTTNRASSAPSGHGTVPLSRAPSRGGHPSDEAPLVPPGSATGARPRRRESLPASAFLEAGAITASSFGAGNVKYKSTGAEGNALNQMRHAVMTGETRAVGGSREMVLVAQTLPRVPSAGGNASTPVGAQNPYQLLMEPPKYLSHNTVVTRLEAQAKAFRQTTFAEYMKENDIFTGVSKVRFDEKRLKNEEEAALRKANMLVGGPAKRQLRLTEGLRRS